MNISRFFTIAGLLLATCVPLPIAAMSLSEALALSLDRDAGLAALHARAEARDEYAVAATALPDPELFLGAQGLPLNDPLDSDMMTMYMIGLRQQFPPGQTRRLAGEQARVQGRAVLAQRQLRQLEISNAVRQRWLAWAGASASLAVAEQGLTAFDELLEFTESRYRAGTGRQRDIDQARLERALRARQVLDAEIELEQAAIDLARWTGRLPLANAPEFPAWPPPAEPSELLERLNTHPALESDRLLIEAGQLGAELERQAYRPMWMVEGGYGHQRGRNPMDQGRQPDRLFAMVSMSLPLFTGNRQDRRVASAEAEVDALGHQRSLRLQEWRGQLQGELSRWHSRHRRLTLNEEVILPDARSTVASTLQAYRRDQASFDELVRARLAEIEQELAVIETRLAWLTSRSELAYLSAEELQ